VAWTRSGEKGGGGSPASSSVAEPEWPGYCSSLPLLLFSSNYFQICVATSKYPKMKVVQLPKIYNFALGTNFKFCLHFEI
jgi:hypothetical protein